MQKLIDEYIKLLNENGENGEKYKWEAIDHFQKNWDIHVDDFYKMFKEAFRLKENLFYQNSWVFIIEASKHFPHEVRKMFSDLFNENIELETRMKNFQESSKQLLPKVKIASKKHKLNDQQDERTLSVYLSFRYPEKYFIYMKSFYGNYCKLMGIREAGQKYKNYLHYLKLAEEFKSRYVINNTELKKLHDKIYPKTTWDSSNLITQNIFFLLLINEDHMEKLTTSNSVDSIILVNITWNSNNWTSPSDDPSNHAWVKEGNIPHESWNFDFDNPRNPENKIFGYAQFTHPPKIKGNNNLIIFHSDKKIVGFYGKAEILHTPVKISETMDYNLIGDRNLSLVLKNKIENIKEKGYYESKQRMGQVGFIYLNNKQTAVEILDEAIRINPDQVQKLSAIKLWLTESEQSKRPERNFGPKKIPLNQIYFGPPGTGKTYNTTNEAVRIVEGLSKTAFAQKYKDREAIKQAYKNYIENGQIAFCTFHQSFSYEDFIEGIKPVKPGDEDKFLKYEVRKGIFLDMARRAESRLKSDVNKEKSFFTLSGSDFDHAVFYKMSLGDTLNPEEQVIYDYCIANNYIAIGFCDGIDFSGMNESEVNAMVKQNGHSTFAGQAINYFKNYLKVGNYVIVSKGNYLARAIGKVTGEYEFQAESPIGYNHFRKVDWLVKDEEIPVADIYQKNFSQQTIYKLNQQWINRDFFSPKNTLTGLPTTTDKKPENFVLVIDEINRGNISQIFGELITLIEEDKRAGAREELRTTLPYSKEEFSVPSNLYLLGTMNTADRSIEALDTALRRRFSFTEMPPDAGLIRNLGVKILVSAFINMANNSDSSVKLAIENETVLFLKNREDFDIIKNEIAGDFFTHKTASEIDSEGLLQELFERNIELLDFEKILLAINNRLEKLIDKDHTIGHGFFMRIPEKKYPFTALQIVFENKIIPLLQEFFYGDFGKIGLVLGDSFIEKTDNANFKFAKFSSYDPSQLNDLKGRDIYRIKDKSDWDFFSIYE